MTGKHIDNFACHLNASFITDPKSQTYSDAIPPCQNMGELPGCIACQGFQWRTLAFCSEGSLSTERGDTNRHYFLKSNRCSPDSSPMKFNYNHTCMTMIECSRNTSNTLPGILQISVNLYKCSRKTHKS